MNSVMSFLTFTTEVLADFESEYMPTLDTKMRLVEKKKIIYRFYLKPMASIYCIRNEGAMAKETKAAILVQETFRRLFNTSKDEPQCVRDRALNMFAERLERSGYPPGERKNIILRGIRRYEKRVKESGPIHKAAIDTIDKRLKDKLLGKLTWYKQGSEVREKARTDWETPRKTPSVILPRRGPKPKKMQMQGQ